MTYLTVINPFKKNIGTFDTKDQFSLDILALRHLLH